MDCVLWCPPTNRVKEKKLIDFFKYFYKIFMPEIWPFQAI
jgi:hypothetical protein